MCKICVSWVALSIEAQCAWISKVYLQDQKSFVLLYRRLLIVGKECKCELLYEHENIEELGCNIPKYIKKKMQWTNVIPATQYTSALCLNNTLVYFAIPNDFCQRVILLCLYLNKYICECKKAIVTVGNFRLVHRDTLCSRNLVHKVMVMLNESKEYLGEPIASYQVIEEEMKNAHCEVQGRRTHYVSEISIIFCFLYISRFQKICNLVLYLK